MKRVLVTGAGGFIGSQASTLFQNKGYLVKGWDIQSGSNKVDIECVDLTNKDEIIRGLAAFTPDIIIHCAGGADVGKSVAFPDQDFNRSVLIIHNLLFAIHDMQGYSPRIVFLSTAGVYGNPAQLPIREDSELRPMSPYALHKVMCEQTCNYFIMNYNMDIKIARIFSAYGAGLRKQIFWDMYRKYTETGYLDMFGTGDESRDYINVNDVIKAIYLLATAESEEVVYNVANGEEITIRHAVETFANVFKIDKDKIRFNGVVREGDPLNWKADISRIESLGYQKSVDLEKGMELYCNWIKELSNNI